MIEPVPVQVSDLLRSAIDDLGEPARHWLAALPRHLAEVADAWGLQLHDQLDHIGHCSAIYPVTTAEGQPAILKATIPHDEAAGEGAALRRWAGEGSARLLRSSDDGFTLLLERCMPGRDLWALPIDAQIDVVAGLLPRLWVDPPDDPTITDLGDALNPWRRRMTDEPHSYRYPAEVVRLAASWAAELADHGERRVLLHGDVNPGNVLTASRERWLAIDPKPFVGEPTFDLAQLALNWAWGNGDQRDDQPERVVRWVSRLAERLELDADRVLQWALVKAVAWSSDPGDVQVLHAAAASVEQHR